MLKALTGLKRIELLRALEKLQRGDDLTEQTGSGQRIALPRTGEGLSQASDECRQASDYGRNYSQTIGRQNLSNGHDVS